MFSVIGKKHARPALASAIAGVLFFAVPSASQEIELRGAVDEEEVDADILSPQQAELLDALATGSIGDPYDPEAESADVLFGQANEDAFEDPYLQSTPPETPARGFEPVEEAPSRDEQGEASQNAEDESGTRTDTQDPTLSTDDRRRAERVSTRVMALESGGSRNDEDPYAPVGLRLGNFLLFTTLEQGLTWTSNADNSPDGKKGVLSETSLQLDAESDWSRHRATIEGSGTYTNSVSGAGDSDLEGEAEAMLELDFAGGYLGRATLGYALGRDSATSPTSLAGVEKQPLRHTVDGSLGLEKALGPALFGVTTEITREYYSDARLDDGAVLPQDDRNSTLAVLRLRGAYELSPAITPFLEAEAGRRIYDEKRDSAGYERSATLFEMSAGLGLDLSEKLSGEVAVGWVREGFDDERLQAISGATFTANLAWSPMRGTIVALDASTSVESSTDPGDSGSLLHEIELALERQMRSNLSGELSFGTEYRDYVGGGYDLILSGEAALTWWLNRYAGLTGRLRHERQTSDLPNRDYKTTSLFVGMKLQR